MRLLRVAPVVCAALLLFSGLAWPVSVKLQEAVLCLSAPAEVVSP